MTDRLRDADILTVQARVHRLPDILAALPAAPGVYLMKDARGKPIYIGKAANLRARVHQYFHSGRSDTRDFVPLLPDLVADIETVVTGNEKEALLLENTLIKQHRPRFNIKLRDDSDYLVLRLDPAAEWPRLEVRRRLGDDGAWYFGPYHSARAARQALRVVNRHFQLRTCTDHVLHNRRRPCLQYQIKRCPAPCVLDVNRAEYAAQVRDVRLFLDGKSDELLDDLRSRMREASANLAFELAAALRDQIAALEKTLQAQAVVARDFADEDVIGFYREGPSVEIAVMSFRAGRLVRSQTFSFRDQEFPDGEVLSSFIGLYYDLHPSVPAALVLPFPLPDAEVRAEWLSELRGAGARRLELVVPARGARRDRLDLAIENAAASFKSRRSQALDTEAALGKLAQRLQLPRLPRIIECYDVSHVQGTDTVASRVVFIDGQPARSRYRTYRLRRLEQPGGRASSTGAPDDFAAMYEVLARRFRRARSATDPAGPWALPDLLVVDGGKGQLGVALAAARDNGIDVSPGTGLCIVALAKRRSGDRPDQVHRPSRSHTGDPGEIPDRIFLPRAKEPIPIRTNSAELYVLQRLRDEAHRFALTFHRAQRRRRTLSSELAAIPGVGPVRQRLLLNHFGSVRRLRSATLEELLATPGITRAVAHAVIDHFTRTQQVAPGALVETSSRPVP